MQRDLLLLHEMIDAAEQAQLGEFVRLLRPAAATLEENR